MKDSLHKFVYASWFEYSYIYFAMGVFTLGMVEYTSYSQDNSNSKFDFWNNFFIFLLWPYFLLFFIISSIFPSIQPILPSVAFIMKINGLFEGIYNGIKGLFIKKES